MNSYFNVSSAGATATTWLTKLLNSHPNIAAYHALRHNPFTQDQRHLTFEELFAGFKICKERMIGVESIGAIHTFYHSTFRQQLKEMGGGHFAIFRNPIRRINSLFAHHYEKSHHIEIIDNNVYKTMIERGHLSNIAQLETVLNSPLNEYERRFFWLCNDAIRNDILNFIQCPPHEICIFEEYTKDKDYFCGLMNVLLDTEDSFLKKTKIKRSMFML